MYNRSAGVENPVYEITKIKFHWEGGDEEGTSTVPMIEKTMPDLKLEVGDILCYEGSSLRSKLIRIITESPLSHIGIVFQNKDTIIHSVGYKGVCIDKTQLPCIVIKHNRGWTNENFDRCLQVLPAGYDVMSALFIHKVSSPMEKSTKSFTCSDFVSFVFGLPFKMSPFSLAKYFLEREGGKAFVLDSNPSN